MEHWFKTSGKKVIFIKNLLTLRHLCAIKSPCILVAQIHSEDYSEGASRSKADSLLVDQLIESEDSKGLTFPK